MEYFRVMLEYYAEAAAPMAAAQMALGLHEDALIHLESATYGTHFRVCF